MGTLFLLGIYGAHRVSLLRRFSWPAPGSGAAAPDPSTPGTPGWAALPRVTVQLPLYNEQTVAERLIQTVGRMDYPRDRFEVQVLDDSNDATCGIVDREVQALVDAGIDARVIRRPDRSGYKAGALDYGMQRSKGELLAIFDADFIPPSDFLLQMVPGFQAPKVGMVQARWEHVNRDESALTRAQSTLLDGHFVIEHKVRADSGLFFNFNGTAGIWRRSCIDAAGGWQHDTLTEDLDLSYRAQLNGWKFLYRPLIAAPAEVPPTISSFKSQQHRWAKGSVQVARKLSGRIWSADIPFKVKLEAAAHLTGNAGYPLVLLLSVLLPFSVAEGTRYNGLWHLLIFLVCTMSVILFYERSQRALGRSRRARLQDVPAAIALGIGMCVGQTRAVWEGLFGDTGEFVRTPKRGELGQASGTRYRDVMKGLPGIELVLAAWFAWSIVTAVRLNMWMSLPFLLLFLTGFSWVGLLSLKDWARARSVG